MHLVGRTQSKLDAVAQEILSAGGQCTVYPTDVTLRGALDHFVDRLDGGVDILVHSVGESLMKSLTETTFEDWQRMLDVNLTSVFIVTHSLLPSLRASSNASIVLISSKTALKGYPVVAYSAAKAGVLGFARSLASELATERIRVVPLCPGPTDTPMRWSSTPEMDPSLVMDVDSIASTVSYLVGLPQGVTADTILVQSVLYD